MKIKFASVLFVIVFGMNGYSQRSPILDSYISEGLENNLTLKQKKLSYQQHMEEITIARGAFFPSVRVHARYTVADGGRIIEFPVGDLLNPVYSTLHQLTRTLPPSQQFPQQQVENQEFRFYRPTEHETKLELVQPIFYPQIYHNNKIKQQLAILGKIDEEAFKRQLIAEIKISYFNYLKTLKLQEVLTNSENLVRENIRVNKSLFKNDKVTIDNVYKAEAELQKLQQQKASVEKNKSAAQGYFNFLLNKPLDAAITSDSGFMFTGIPDDLDTAQQIAAKNSKDLEALKVSLEVAERNISLEKASFLPTVSAVIDYGFQGESYAFTANDDFVLASLVLQWEIFKGKQNRAALEKAKINQEIQQTKMEEANAAIKLDVMNLFNEIEARQKQIDATEKENIANKAVFEIIQKKYAQGRASMLESTDARTAYQNSGQQLAIARFDYYILLAELEKTLGLLTSQAHRNE